MLPRAYKILEFVKGPSILDVGCAGHVPKPGSPYWLHGALRERFQDVWGIDISEQNIDSLKARGYENLMVSSAETFELGKKFDTIVAGELIEHLSNPGLFLERAKAHLKPGGRLVLTTPTPFSLLNMLYAFLKYPKTCSNPEHTCWFCPATIRSLVDRYGFHVSTFELIEDYELDNPSFLYRLFVRFIQLFGLVIPKRLRCNTMLLVLYVV